MLRLFQTYHHLLDPLLLLLHLTMLHMLHLLCLLRGQELLPNGF